VSDETSAPGAGRRLARDLALYTVARLALLALIAALIVGIGRLAMIDVPLLVALLFALVIALPLSYVLFRKLRVRVNEDIAAVDAKRRHDKARLRAQLRGDVDPEPSPAADAEGGAAS